MPNTTEVGWKLTVEETPMPDRATVWGLLASESFTVRVPVRLPVAVGVNVTLIVQFDPAARLLPQVSV